MWVFVADLKTAQCSTRNVSLTPGLSARSSPASFASPGVLPGTLNDVFVIGCLISVPPSVGLCRAAGAVQAPGDGLRAHANTTTNHSKSIWSYMIVDAVDRRLLLRENGRGQSSCRNFGFPVGQSLCTLRQRELR